MTTYPKSTACLVLIQFTYTRWCHITFCHTHQYFIYKYHVTRRLDRQACLLHYH